MSSHMNLGSVVSFATFEMIFKPKSLNLNTFVLKNMNLDSFSKKIRYLRIERNLNQREFAKLINRGFTTVCNWEQGNRMPTPETIKDISNILDIDYTYLLDN